VQVDVTTVEAPPGSDAGKHPLRHDMVVLDVQDVALVATSLGTGASLSAFSYAAASDQLVKIAEQPYDVQDSVTAARAVLNTELAQQEVVLVHAGGIDFVSRSDGEVTVASCPLASNGAVVIAGGDPYSGTDVWLLVNDDKRVEAVKANRDQGVVRRHLLERSSGESAATKAVVGTVAAGEIVSNGAGSYLVGLVETGGTLTAYAAEVPSADDDGPLVCSELAVGTCDIELGVTSVTAVLDSKPGEQAVFTHVDAGRDGHLTALRVDDAGALAVAGSTLIDTSFAPPDTGRFRLAAGPLWQADTAAVPIVVGYAGKFGGINDCACLMLYEYDAVSGKLVQASTYAVDTNDDASLASNDLHLGAGIFDLEGEALWGVLVLGGGASLKQLMTNSSSIRGAVVGVDQNLHRFPQQTASDGPERLATTELVQLQGQSSFIGLGVDLTGRSVILGQPTFTSRLACSQILAVIQAPPFESALTATRPTLTFTQHREKSQNYNVSSNKMWTKSQDFGAHFSLGPISIGTQLNKTVARGFDKVDDSIVSESVQVTDEVTENDLLVVYSVGYSCWEYPALQNGKPGGTVLVVIPDSQNPALSFPPAHDKDYGYLQQHENGSLLTYVDPDLVRIGYSDDRLIFEEVSISVLGDQTGGASVTFDRAQMTSDAIGKSFSVHQSAGDSAGFSAAGDLFGFLPVSFGLSLTDSSSYSDSEMKTTTLTNTEMLGISITSGTVPTGTDYDYGFTPVVFQHATLGCLMVSYRVELSGSAWTAYHPSQPLKLIALRPLVDDDPVLRGLSRSISFSQAGSGDVRIEVEVFNNGLRAVSDVDVEVFVGPTKPTKDPDPTPSAPYAGWRFPTEKPVAKGTIQSIGAVGRATISFRSALADGDYVGVFVSQPPFPSDAGYWNQYPHWDGK
jgi:hypothetical protein